MQWQIISYLYLFKSSSYGYGLVRDWQSPGPSFTGFWDHDGCWCKFKLFRGMRMEQFFAVGACFFCVAVYVFSIKVISLSFLIQQMLRYDRDECWWIEVYIWSSSLLFELCSFFLCCCVRVFVQSCFIMQISCSFWFNRSLCMNVVVRISHPHNLQSSR